LQAGTRKFLFADAMLDDVLQLLTDGGFQFSRLPAHRWVAVIVNRASPPHHVVVGCGIMRLRLSLTI
jgi:hypothetical protein